jgi:hypothetical protein
VKAIVEKEGWKYLNKPRSKGEIVEVTGDCFNFFERLEILSKYQEKKKEVKKDVDNKHGKPSNTN